jgi:hypothetical protein
MSKVDKALKNIVGLEVIVEQDMLKQFEADDSGFVGERPLAIVKPTTVVQLTQLMAWAKQLNIQLMPISSSMSHHRGDTLCETKSCVVVDMTGFDDVIRTDRRNRVIMLEAGVTFSTLDKSARSVGLRTLLPLCPRPGKSALAAYLEHEPTIYPRFMWDTADPLMCLEVIFGSGELFRTGSAAGPGTIEEQWEAGNCQKTPMGPGHSDLQRIVQGAQGSLGIVTWCTTKAEPIPTKETLYVLESDSLDDLIEVTYKLLRRELPDICFIVDALGLSALKRSNENDVMNKVVNGKKWNLVFSLSAPEIYGDEKLAYVQEEVQEICERFSLDHCLYGFEARHQELHEIILDPSHPKNKQWWKQNGKTATHELFFQTTLDSAAQFVPTAQRSVNKQDIITYIQPQLGGRYCHMEFIFPYDKKDSAQDNSVQTLAVNLAVKLKGKGAFFSRPYGPIGRIAKNDKATQKMFTNLKVIFDPNNVLAASSVTSE